LTGSLILSYLMESWAITYYAHKQIRRGANRTLYRSVEAHCRPVISKRSQCELWDQPELYTF